MDTKKSKDVVKGLNFAVYGNFHWAGNTYRQLGGAVEYNPRVPVLIGDLNRSKVVDVS